MENRLDDVVANLDMSSKDTAVNLIWLALGDCLDGRRCAVASKIVYPFPNSFPNSTSRAVS